MSRSDWESKFATWSQGPGKTEAERCENARRIVTNCLNDAGVLKKYEATVFAQGSYPNRTNIPQESDVDICVRTDQVFFGEYTKGLTREAFGFAPGAFTYRQFKDDVGRALTDRFGSEVTRGAKCFTLRENTYHVDADVVPTVEHRRYYQQYPPKFHSGTAFIPDGATTPIYNWPHQHIENGMAKHGRTGDRFKKVVRILKRLQFDMVEDGTIKERVIPSYALECCAYNIGDSFYMKPSWFEQVKTAVEIIYHAATTDGGDKWVEVNELKWLLIGAPWTKAQVADLMLKMYSHAELGK